MKKILAAISFLFSISAFGQISYIPPAGAAYCWNAASSKWVIMASTSAGSPIAYAPKPVALYGFNGSSYYPLACDASGNLTLGSLSSVTTTYYVDANVAGPYTPNGSQQMPFKTLGAAFAAMTGSGPYALVLAPNSAYADTGPISGPSAFITIYGNGSTWTVTGNVTLNGAFYITDLRTVVSGTLTYAATTTTESVRIGGSLQVAGGIFTSGYEHFFDLSILMNTLVTLNVGATPVFTNVVGTPRFKSATGAYAAFGTTPTVLTILNSSSLATGAYTNIDMSNGGIVTIRGFAATNNGTVSNINLSGSNGTGVTAPNILDGVQAGIVTSGSSFTTIDGTDYLPYITGTNLNLLGPINVAKIAQASQTASIVSTVAFTATASGLYRYTGAVRTTTAGTAGTVLLTLNGTASSTASLTSLTAQQSVSGITYLQAGETITYSTTVASNSGGQYRDDVLVEWIK